MSPSSGTSHDKNALLGKVNECESFHIDRNLARFWSERAESHDDELAVPQRGENVRVANQNRDVLRGGKFTSQQRNG